jgi:hypothetical protein
MPSRRSGGSSIKKDVVSSNGEIPTEVSVGRFNGPKALTLKESSNDPARVEEMARRGLSGFSVGSLCDIVRVENGIVRLVLEASKRP